MSARQPPTERELAARLTLARAAAVEALALVELSLDPTEHATVLVLSERLDANLVQHGEVIERHRPACRAARQADDNEVAVYEAQRALRAETDPLRAQHRLLGSVRASVEAYQQALAALRQADACEPEHRDAWRADAARETGSAQWFRDYALRCARVLAVVTPVTVNPTDRGDHA